MKINHEKTKFILFNPAKSLDFMPEFKLCNKDVELVEEMKLLGIIFRSDLKWSTNTENMVLKGYRRVWMLRRLKQFGANTEDLLDVYFKQVRSVLELVVPVWHSSITVQEKCDIDRVQRAALHIILGFSYSTYLEALESLNIESLEARRVKLCSKFAHKAVKHEKFKNWFKINETSSRTRQEQPRYCHVKARLKRYQMSPLSYSKLHKEEMRSLINNSLKLNYRSEVNAT